MAEHTDYNQNRHLTDDQLSEREEGERREFMRLERKEPHLRDTTYRTLSASRALLHAWERWSRTAAVMRVRGLLSRGS